MIPSLIVLVKASITPTACNNINKHCAFLSNVTKLTAVLHVSILYAVGGHNKLRFKAVHYI